MNGRVWFWMFVVLGRELPACRGPARPWLVPVRGAVPLHAARPAEGALVALRVVLLAPRANDRGRPPAGEAGSAGGEQQLPQEAQQLTGSRLNNCHDDLTHSGLGPRGGAREKGKAGAAAAAAATAEEAAAAPQEHHPQQEGEEQLRLQRSGTAQDIKTRGESKSAGSRSTKRNSNSSSSNRCSSSRGPWALLLAPRYLGVRRHHEVRHLRDRR